MIDNLKKYWFVVVIALVLVVGIGFYAKQQMGTVLKGKTVEGKQVVSEIAGENYFADDYYQDLKDRYGNSELYKLFERSVLSSIETSPEVATKAKENAEAIKKNVSAQQGTTGLKNLENTVIALGYSGLDELNIVYEDMAKRDQIIVDFINANKETYLDSYIAEKKPRTVSHILVKMTDPNNPTAAEQTKIDEVEKQLAEGKEFADIAMALSDDTGSASQGGSVGFADTSTNLVTEFLDQAVAMSEGEVSGWVQTQYGRHIIKVDSTNPEEFVKNDEIKAKYIEGITNLHKDLTPKAIWEKGQNLEITFKDEALKKQLLEFMGITEGE